VQAHRDRLVPLCVHIGAVRVDDAIIDFIIVIIVIRAPTPYTPLSVQCCTSIIARSQDVYTPLASLIHV
jgi:hypothetical protein